MCIPNVVHDLGTNTCVEVTKNTTKTVFEINQKEKDANNQFSDVNRLKSSILSSMIKQRKDSIEQFAKGGRTDLVEKEEAELKILQEFMPAQMSKEEVDAVIKKTIEEAGAVSIKDMGKVMKVLMPKLTGVADGKIVGEKVKAFLSR